MLLLGIVFHYSFWVEVYRHFAKHLGFIKAAALSYYAFLSFIPVMVLTISILGLFLQSNVKATEWILSIVQQFTPTGFETIKEIIHTTLRISSTSTFIGFIGLLWSLLIFFGILETIFNQLWHVEKKRHYLVSKLVGLSLMSVLLLSTIITFFTTNMLLIWLSTEDWAFLKDSPFLSHLPKTTTYMFQLIFLIISYFLIYKIIPAVRVRFAAAASGAIFASIASELARIGYRLYIQQFPVRNLFYGSLLTIVVLLVWLNYTMIILVLGCEIARTVQKIINEKTDALPS
jgi:membrane protein